MKEVLSLGAGVQSTTVFLMSLHGVLPRLDAAIFADTQWEPAAVYRHLKWLKEVAAQHGVPILTGTAGDLRADSIEFRRNGGRGSGEAGARRYASIPLFVRNPDGTVGMINRQCTSEYKIKVVERIIRRDLLGLRKAQVAPARAVRHWFGISSEEQSRRRVSQNHWQTFYYPLCDSATSSRKDTLFGRGYDRRDCLEWLATHSYPKPPRSACLGCPFRSDREWLRMQLDDPEGWADAVAFDRAIRAASAALQATGKVGRLVGLPYVHRSCVPLDEVVFHPKDLAAARVYGMENECAGVCGV